MKSDFEDKSHHFSVYALTANSMTSQKTLTLNTSAAYAFAVSVTGLRIH